MSDENPNQTWELKIGRPDGSFYSFETLGDKAEATRVAKLFLVALKETSNAQLAVMVTGEDDHFIVNEETQ